MKALILAGGSGTRLRPITHTSSKQLVPVANRPILFYALDHMAEAGLVEVGMIVGDTADEIRAAVGDGSKWGLRVTYIPQEAPLGLAHCVRIAGDFLGDDDFVMYLGDNFLVQGVRSFVERFESHRHATLEQDQAVAQILLAKVPDPHRFGVAELDSAGRVVRLVEKPVDPPSDLALVGVYLFDRSIHQAVAAIEPSGRGELEITDAIQWLIDQGMRVRSEVVEGYWKDIGELEPLLDGNSLVLSSLDYAVLGTVDDESRVDTRVRVEPGAKIVRSMIRGPALIGADAVIEDSFIGPFTAIAEGCSVIRSEVEHSMVMTGSTVIDAGRLEDSLVGRDCEVTRSQRRPSASRLMIGDHSKVDLA